MTHGGRYIPPDPSQGDESTVGGYAAVHARAAALEGRDGFSYSLEILSDSTGEAAHPYGAYLMFVQWSRLGAQKVEGHLESDFLGFGESAAAAEATLGAMKLAEAQRILDALLRTRDGESSRRWFNALKDAPDLGHHEGA